MPIFDDDDLVFTDDYVVDQILEVAPCALEGPEWIACTDFTVVDICVRFEGTKMPHRECSVKWGKGHVSIF